jgi:hypothetical protein
MTQLIENKPRRHAMIATLLHFCTSRHASRTLALMKRSEEGRFRAVNCECACGSVEGAAQVPGEGSLGDRRAARISNRQIPESTVDLTPAVPTRALVLIANFCDIHTSVFLASTPFAITNSNRRKSATFSFLQKSSPLRVSLTMARRAIDNAGNQNGRALR